MAIESSHYRVTELQDRFGIGKQAVYNRLEALQIKPIKEKNRSYVSLDQLNELDSLHKHILSGGTMASFQASLSRLPLPNNKICSSKLRIAVAARKGGVGKTTIACGLASVLSSQNRKVLVVDLDPQSNAAYVLGVDPVAPGTAELLIGKKINPLKAALNLDVMPGGPELASNKIQSLHPEDLSEAIETLNYDALIFDCPPGNEYLERLGLVAANTALVITNAHPLAVLGAARVMDILKTYSLKNRKGPQQWALILSQIDSRRSLDKQFAPQLAKKYPQVPQFLIHQDTNLSLAAAEQIPVIEYAPKARGVMDLKALVKWITNLEKINSN